MNRFIFTLSLILLQTMASAQDLTIPKMPLSSETSTDYVWVAAHRADCIYAPENSIEALEHALKFGADIIETDVRMTKDGHFVIMHDYTVDRTTDGTGRICDLTLEEIKKMHLKTNWGGRTELKVPTLEDYIALARNRAHLYLDKAGYDLPGNEEGSTVKALLSVLRQEGVLNQTMFVLDWPYEKAKRVFGNDLEKVIFCPVVEDRIPMIETQVEEYIEKLHPLCFQFRMSKTDSKTYALLPQILQSGAKAFVAATWDNHTAGHSDQISIFSRPSEGWGWLIDKGFRIIETNYPKDLIFYLKSENRH